MEPFFISNIYKSLYDCTGDEVDDLSFKTGDIVYILERLSTKWCLAYLNGKCGYASSNYLTQTLSDFILQVIMDI